MNSLYHGLNEHTHTLSLDRLSIPLVSIPSFPLLLYFPLGFPFPLSWMDVETIYIDTGYMTIISFIHWFIHWFIH